MKTLLVVLVVICGSVGAIAYGTFLTLSYFQPTTKAGLHHISSPVATVASTQSSPSSSTGSPMDTTPLATGDPNNTSSPTQAPSTDNPANPAGGGHHWGNGGAGGGGGGAAWQQRGRQMFAQLGLTTDQQQQITQILNTITDRKERRDAIMKVLTPDQQAKLQELRAQMKAQFGGGNGGAGGGMRGGQ